MPVRRRPDTNRGGRSRLTASLAAAILTGLLALAAAVRGAGAGQGNPLALLWITDDFLDTSGVDAALTTAAVDTNPPGVVRLPKRIGSASQPVALRPGKQQMILAVPGQGPQPAQGPQPLMDLIGYAYTGTQMRPFPPWTMAGVGPVTAVAWSGDGGHLAVALTGGVDVYAFSGSDMPKKVAQIPVPLARALAGGPGRDLWVLDRDTARYYRWTGSRYREIPALAITGLAGASAITSNPDRAAFMVLQGDRIRYFAGSAGQYRELAAYSATVPGAASVAAVRAGGYRVLVKDARGNAIRTVYIGVGQSGSRLVPGADDTLPEGAAMIAPSPWGDMDYVAVTPWGVRYRAYDGRGWRADLSRSIQGSWWQSGSVGSSGEGYQPNAALVSTVTDLPLIPLGRVRLIATYTTPQGTSVGFDVSTDGGTTWTEVLPDTNTPVPVGYAFAYRIRLHTDNPAVTPEVDRVEFRQVTITDTRASLAGMRVKVRLVR